MVGRAMLVVTSTNRTEWVTSDDEITGLAITLAIPARFTSNVCPRNMRTTDSRVARLSPTRRLNGPYVERYRANMRNEQFGAICMLVIFKFKSANCVARRTNWTPTNKMNALTRLDRLFLLSDAWITWWIEVLNVDESGEDGARRSKNALMAKTMSAMRMVEILAILEVVRAFVHGATEEIGSKLETPLTMTLSALPTICVTIIVSSQRK